MFGIYDDLTPDHVPGLQKYDKCMTEQVPGPQGVKIVGRHMPSAPYGQVLGPRPDFHLKKNSRLSPRTNFCLQSTSGTLCGLSIRHKRAFFRHPVLDTQMRM